jgi:hypothetical protein
MQASLESEVARRDESSVVTKFTVWSYDYDAAQHHKNDLQEDTVADLFAAVALARQRAAETNQNTGYSKIVDWNRAKMGDRGVIAIFKKDKNGRVFVTDVRDDLKGKLSKAPA